MRFFRDWVALRRTRACFGSMSSLSCTSSEVCSYWSLILDLSLGFVKGLMGTRRRPCMHMYVFSISCSHMHMSDMIRYRFCLWHQQMQFIISPTDGKSQTAMKTIPVKLLCFLKTTWNNIWSYNYYINAFKIIFKKKNSTGIHVFKCKTNNTFFF